MNAGVLTLSRGFKVPAAQYFMPSKIHQTSWVTLLATAQCGISTAKMVVFNVNCALRESLEQ